MAQTNKSNNEYSNLNKFRVCNIHWQSLLSFVWRVAPPIKEGKPPGFGFPCSQYSTVFDTGQELSDILPENLRQNLRQNLRHLKYSELHRTTNRFIKKSLKMHLSRIKLLRTKQNKIYAILTRGEC